MGRTEREQPHPGVQLSLQDFLPVSLSVATSVSDKIYAIIFITTMGSSVLILCLSGFMSRDPIFAKDVFKLPRFQYRDYEAISSHAQIGDAIDHNNKRNAVPERLTGWRLRLGVLQSLILLSLVTVHTVILVTDCATFLRIVFIVYWVYQLIP